jgi:uncharacterized SAM-binding protein YcdF (DUF218 family)
MAAFLYRVLLRVLDPTTLAVLLLLAAPFFRRRVGVRRLCYGLGLGILLVCGNGWVVRSLTVRLESAYPSPTPIPAADAIVILSGGVHASTPPRPTVEVNDAGDRVLYGAELFRRGLAPQIVCTGDVGTGGIALRSEAEDMADMLVMIGVPKPAIVLETKAKNTHEHAVNLCPMFEERNIKRVLLVTTAMHMPRSVGVFRRSCPTVDYIAAPTDFHAVDRLPVAVPWYRHAITLLPTPGNLAGFSALAHEYLGLLYYKLRGWV